MNEWMNEYYLPTQQKASTQTYIIILYRRWEKCIRKRWLSVKLMEIDLWVKCWKFYWTEFANLNCMCISRYGKSVCQLFIWSFQVNCFLKLASYYNKHTFSSLNLLARCCWLFWILLIFMNIIKLRLRVRTYVLVHTIL